MSGGGIGWAVDMLRFDERVRRAGWNGKGMWLQLKQPPYVIMSTVQGDLVPWSCSQADLLAMDWELAE